MKKLLALVLLFAASNVYSMEFHRVHTEKKGNYEGPPPPCNEGFSGGGGSYDSPATQPLEEEEENTAAAAQKPGHPILRRHNALPHPNLVPSTSGSGTVLTHAQMGSR